MDVDNVITFGQDDLSSVSFAAFRDMRERGELCDLTIRMQNHSFSAHRVILAAAIPYFRSMFVTSVGQKEEKDITEDLDPRALESLIDFAYSSKVNISTENAISLFKASQILQISQVSDACVQFLSERLRFSNVIQIRISADNFSNIKLGEIADNFIRENFEEIATYQEFTRLPYSCIKGIVSDDDLKVSSEELVFQAVMHWVKASPLERPALLPELLSEVRLVCLPKDYLIHRVAPEELIRTSKLCMDLINEAKSYHLVLEEGSALPNFKTVPRKCITNNNTIYAVCQCHTSGKISAYYYDFSSEAWHYLSCKATDTFVHFVVPIKEKMYMFLREAIQSFNVKTLEWKILEPRHENIVGASIVPYGDRIYCFGSYSELDNLSVRCFDTEQNQWREKLRMMTKRYEFAAVSLEEFIYVIGGFAGLQFESIDLVEKYNLSTCQWSKSAPMLIRRTKPGCISMTGKIYVCGGIGTANFTSCMAEQYDTLTDRWNFISCLETARYAPSMISLDRKIYALGGISENLSKDDDEWKYIKDSEVYDPENNCWKSLFSVPDNFVEAVLCPAPLENTFTKSMRNVIQTLLQ